jgi:hypothetical protein
LCCYFARDSIGHRIIHLSAEFTNSQGPWFAISALLSWGLLCLGYCTGPVKFGFPIHGHIHNSFPVQGGMDIIILVPQYMLSFPRHRASSRHCPRVSNNVKLCHFGGCKVNTGGSGILHSWAKFVHHRHLQGPTIVFEYSAVYPWRLRLQWDPSLLQLVDDWRISWGSLI